MAPRQSLHNTLKALLGSDRVYFQRPPRHKIPAYPAIVYRRSGAESIHGDNIPYLRLTQYEITVMDQDPDGWVAEKVAALPGARFSRHFRANDLNHDVYTLYH